MSGTEWTEPGRGANPVVHETVNSTNSVNGGTEWTEPGQGATVEMLWDVLPDAMSGIEYKSGSYYALGCLALRFDTWQRRTNLRLTGSPMTAEDLKRIEQCEVSR